MNEVEKLQAELREATFTMREVAATLESERTDWERREAEADAANAPWPSIIRRRIEQLRIELAYQRDKLRRQASNIEKWSLGKEA